MIVEVMRLAKNPFGKNVVYEDVVLEKPPWEGIRLFGRDTVFFRPVSANAPLVVERVGEGAI